MKKVLLTSLFGFFSWLVMGGELEHRLNTQWRGSWVILKTDIYSNCNGFFSNNQVNQGRITSKANRHFQPGELAKIQKINVKRSRISVLLLLAEPILESHQEGPFTLFTEVQCKAELRFTLDKSIIKQSNITAIQAALQMAMMRFDSEGQATTATIYNQRLRQAYPEDYQQTLADYEQWQREQKLLAIHQKMTDAIEEMSRILARVQKNDAYARGFVAGIRAMARKRLGDCAQLVHVNPEAWLTGPQGRVTQSYQEGYNDGQHLAFYQALVNRLDHCTR